MKRLMLVLGLSVVAVALVACGAVKPDTAAKKQATRSVESSVTVDGVVYRLTVPAVTLEAGTNSSATYEVTNSTDATLSAQLSPVITLSSAEGVLQLSGIPLNALYLAVAEYLGPKQVVSESVAFKVPAPGSCAIEMSYGDAYNNLVVEFESTEAP